MTVTDNRERYNARRRITPTPKVCEWCGGSFTPKRSDARTCGDAHRQALSRWERGKSETPPPITAIPEGGDDLAAEVQAGNDKVRADAEAEIAAGNTCPAQPYFASVPDAVLEANDDENLALNIESWSRDAARSGKDVGEYIRSNLSVHMYAAWLRHKAAARQET